MAVAIVVTVPECACEGRCQLEVTTMPDRILLTTLEAARLMAVSTRTIFEWTSSGELEAVRLGRAVRYTRDELVRFVESKKTAAVK